MKTMQWGAIVAGFVACAGSALAQPAAYGTGPATPLVLSIDPSGEANSGRFWVSADYLLWWVKDGPTHFPLVTTGPNNLLFSGSLDIPGTRVLFGGNGIDYGASSGGRLSGGMWLDDCRTVGVEVGGFLLEKSSESFRLAGDANGQPFFGRPFINALTGAQNVYFVSQNFSDPALSAGLTGRLTSSSSTRLWGWEANGVMNVRQGGGWRVDGLAGFRSLGLDEDIEESPVLRNVRPGGAASFLGTTADVTQSVAVRDSFRTFNRFYGPQVGARIDGCRGALRFGATAKVALGVSHQESKIQGDTTLLGASGEVLATAPGGVFALPTNIGRQTRDRFAVVPEVGLNVGVQITPSLRAQVGYSFLYCSSVARPGSQFDPVVNPRLVPTDATFGQPGVSSRPRAAFTSDDFWAQGVNFGLVLEF